MTSDFKDVKGLTYHYKFYGQTLFSISSHSPRQRKAGSLHLCEAGLCSSSPIHKVSSL